MAKSVLGVWRLVSITHGGVPVLTSKTHMVFTPSQSWAVWPGMVYYETDRRPPTSKYTLTWNKKGVGQLTVHSVVTTHQCSLVKQSGNKLTLRCNSVAGIMPESFDDNGSLETYARETDREVVARLQKPPRQIKAGARKHPLLGKLTYDVNFTMWATTMSFGKKRVKLEIDSDDATTDAYFTRIAKLVAKLDPAKIAKFAATQLLSLYNETWSQDDKPLDAAAFIKRIKPTMVAVDPERGVLISYDDGDLFAGHVIHVSLSSKLAPESAEIAG